MLSNTGRPLRLTRQKAKETTDEVLFVEPSSAKKAARTKAISNILESEELMKRLLSEIEKILRRFDNAVLLLHSKDSSKDFYQTELIKLANQEKLDDFGSILKAICQVKERYMIPSRYATRPSTTLVSLHDKLVEKIMQILTTNAGLKSTLGLNLPVFVLEPEYFPVFHDLLRLVPLSVRTDLLCFLSFFYQHYLNFMQMRELQKPLGKLIYFTIKCEEFIHQLYISYMLGCLRHCHQKLVNAFAIKCGLRGHCNELAFILDKCSFNREPLHHQQFPPFAYKIATLINNSKGIHRKVFSFPLQNSIFASYSKTGIPLEIENPFSQLDIQWEIHFNKGSQSICFEIESESETSQRVFIQIPFSKIHYVLVDNGIGNILISFRCQEKFRNFVDQFRLKLSELELCDSLTFQLKVGLNDRATIALLEEALFQAFGSRAGDDDEFFGCWKNCPFSAADENDSFDPFKVSNNHQREFPRDLFTDKRKKNQELAEIDLIIEDMESLELYDIFKSGKDVEKSVSPNKKGRGKKTTTQQSVEEINGMNETDHGRSQRALSGSLEIHQGSSSSPPVSSSGNTDVVIVENGSGNTERTFVYQDALDTDIPGNLSTHLEIASAVKTVDQFVLTSSDGSIEIYNSVSKELSASERTSVSERTSASESISWVDTSPSSANKQSSSSKKRSRCEEDVVEIDPPSRRLFASEPQPTHRCSVANGNDAARTNSIAAQRKPRRTRKPAELSQISSPTILD